MLTLTDLKHKQSMKLKLRRSVFYVNPVQKLQIKLRHVGEVRFNKTVKKNRNVFELDAKDFKHSLTKVSQKNNVIFHLKLFQRQVMKR